MRFRLRERDDPDALHAIGVARQLVLGGAENTEAIRRLRDEVRGPALRRAAKDTASLGRESFPWPGIHQLLAAAAGQISLTDRSEAEATLEERCVELLAVSTSAAFAVLAEGLPVLLELESRALSIRDDPDVSAATKPWHADIEPATLRLLALKPLLSQAALTVGPTSTNPDPLLASKLVLDIVNHHLAGVAGVIPT